MMTAWRMGLVLARMRLRRIGSMLRKRKTREGDRLGEQPKQRSWIMMPILLLVILFSLGSWGYSVVSEMMRALGDGGLRSETGIITLTAPAKSDGVSLAVLAIVGVIVTIVLIYQACLQLGNKDVGTADWDIEWLATLPIPRATVALAKIVELTATSWATWSMAAGVMVAFTVLFGDLTRSVVVLPIGVLLLSATGSAIAYVVETWMRLSLRTSARQNIQASLGILSGILIIPIFGIAGRPEIFRSAARALDVWWAQWLPGALLARSLVDSRWMHAARSFGYFSLECVGTIALAVFLSHHLQQDGISGGGSRVGKRSQQPLQVRTFSRSWLTAIQRRDLLLLRRDRNLLVQMVVLPMLFVGMQIFAGGAKNAFESPQSMGAIVFGAGAYALAFSGLQLLVPDGKALWLTLAQPISIEALMRQKVKLIGALALTMGALIALVVAWRAPALSFEHFAVTLFAMTGIVIYSGIAGALGVFAYDATAIEIRQRVKQQYMMLYMVLIAFFSYAVLSQSFWDQLVLLVLSIMLSIALWQKARDLFPYLFDPTSQPELQVAASDGILALMAYFVLQGLFLLLFALFKAPASALLFLASAHAAATVCLGAWFMLGKKRRAELPRLGGGGIWLAAALLMGPVLGYGASHYSHYARVWFDVDTPQAESLHWYFALFAVIVAPLVEEYIFRGVLLTGLRRQLTPLLAVLASAALFAVVHPPMSIAPVFVLGLGTATLATVSRRLMPSVLLHFAYNATVVWLAID